jgi:DNA-binding IclR family transcriptional regulator
MLNVLNAFDADLPIRSSEDLIRLGGGSRATGYRYLVTLQRAGLLAAVANGHYSLGPRIAELDRMVRLGDPLYQASGDFARRLTRETGHTTLVCALYADRVLCIRDERSEDGPSELFNRGQTRPLFTAAASKIIMAYLAPQHLRRVYRNNADAIARAGLGKDWAGFLAALRAIRAVGHCYTVGEFNPGIAGISAPVFNRGRSVIGSLGLAMQARHVTPETLPRLAAAVMRAAAALNQAMLAADAPLDASPRAVGRTSLSRAN